MNQKKEQELVKLHKLRSSLLNKTGFTGGELFEKCTFLNKQMKKPKRAIISGFACGICVRIALDSKKPSRTIKLESVLDVVHDRDQKSIKIVSGFNYIRVKRITLGFHDDQSASKVVDFLHKHCFSDKFIACSPLELLFKEWVIEVVRADSENFSMSKIDLTSKYFKIMSTLGILASGFGNSITRKLDLKKFTFKAYVDTFKSRYFTDCDYNELFSDLIAKGMLKFGGKTVNEFAVSNVHLFDSKKDPVQYKEILPKLLLATSIVEPEMYCSWFNGNGKEDESEDLDRPLKDFFCSSSHNTYLVLAQYGGYALADPYRYVLLQGARCIEIDVYDNENQSGESWPIVTHTQFLNVTPVPLRDCLVAIDETAFVASKCPVVISFENHCEKKGQAEIARQLIEIFGDKIVTEMEFKERLGRRCTLRNCQNRILIKNKKSSKTKNENSNNNDVPLENDLSSLVSYYEPVKVEMKRLANFNAKCKEECDGLGESPHYVMSLNELKSFEFITLNEKTPKRAPQVQESADKLNSQTELQDEEISKADKMEALKFYRHNTVRIYPKMTRLNSSNFNPMQFLASGCQMVALNFQTLDLNLKSLNDFFMLNGNCGYVLRPSLFNSSQNASSEALPETSINIRIVAMIRQIPGELKIHLYSFNKKPHKTQTKIGAKSMRKVSLINGLACQKFELINNPECSFVHFKFKTANGKRFTQFLPLYALSNGYSHLILRDPEGIEKPLIFFAFISCKTSSPQSSKEIPQMTEIQARQNAVFDAHKHRDGGGGADQKQIINLLKSAIYGDSLFRFQSFQSQSCLSLSNNNKNSNLGSKIIIDPGEITQNLKSSHDTIDEEGGGVDDEFNEKIEQIAERLRQNEDLLRKWEQGLENQRKLDMYNLHNVSSNTGIKDLNKMMIAKKKQDKVLKKLVTESGAEETFAAKSRDEIYKYVEKIRKENAKEKFKIKKLADAKKEEAQQK